MSGCQEILVRFDMLVLEQFDIIIDVGQAFVVWIPKAAEGGLVLPVLLSCPEIVKLVGLHADLFGIFVPDCLGVMPLSLWMDAD